MSTLVAREPFAAPAGVVIVKGQSVDSSDPVVKGREHLFQTAEEAAQLLAEPVLTATERPGEDDVILEAVDAPPEETDSPESVAAAEVGSEDRQEPAGGLTTDAVKPVRTRRQQRGK